MAGGWGCLGTAPLRLALVQALPLGTWATPCTAAGRHAGVTGMRVSQACGCHRPFSRPHCREAGGAKLDLGREISVHQAPSAPGMRGSW